jgi:hypothetical protein
LPQQNRAQHACCRKRAELGQIDRLLTFNGVFDRVGLHRDEQILQAKRGHVRASATCHVSKYSPLEKSRIP